MPLTLPRSCQGLARRAPLAAPTASRWRGGSPGATRACSRTGGRRRASCGVGVLEAPEDLVERHRVVALPRRVEVDLGPACARRADARGRVRRSPPRAGPRGPRRPRRGSGPERRRLAGGAAGSGAAARRAGSGAAARARARRPAARRRGPPRTRGCGRRAARVARAEPRGREAAARRARGARRRRLVGDRRGRRRGAASAAASVAVRSPRADSRPSSNASRATPRTMRSSSLTSPTETLRGTSRIRVVIAAQPTRPARIARIRRRPRCASRASSALSADEQSDRLRVDAAQHREVERHEVAEQHEREHALDGGPAARCTRCTPAAPARSGARSARSAPRPAGACRRRRGTPPRSGRTRRAPSSPRSRCGPSRAAPASTPGLFAFSLICVFQRYAIAVVRPAPAMIGTVPFSARASVLASQSSHAVGAPLDDELLEVLGRDVDLGVHPRTRRRPARRPRATATVR